MTRDEREKLRALAQAATPGPWVWEATRKEDVSCQHVLAAGGGNPACGEGVAYTYYRTEVRAGNTVFLPEKRGNAEDAAYIAAANPSTVLALLDAFEDAERERDEARLLGEEKCRWFYERAIKAEAKLDASDREIEALEDALEQDVPRLSRLKQELRYLREIEQRYGEMAAKLAKAVDALEAAERVVEAARKANIALGTHGMQGWAVAFDHLNQALCEHPDDERDAARAEVERLREALEQIEELPPMRERERREIARAALAKPRSTK